MSTKTQRTFLVTGVGGPAGSSLANQLRSRGHKVIGTDIKECDTPLDHFVLGPRADDLALIPFLTSLVNDTFPEIDTFVPTVQDELPAVAAARGLFQAAVVVSSATGAALCQDKWLTAKALEARGLSVPITVTGDKAPLDFPFIAKPRVSRGGRGVVVVESAAQVPATSADLVFQSFASGVEYCPQIYRSPLTGQVTVAVMEKTTMKEGNVGNADEVKVVSSLETNISDVVALATAAVAQLDLLGPIDMDIRRTEDGTPVILEINARFGANSANTPEILDLLLEDLFGGGFEPYPL